MLSVIVNVKRVERTTNLLREIEEVLHDIWILKSPRQFIFYNFSRKVCRRTASIAPSTLSVVKVACSNTLTTSRTMTSTSWEGTARSGAVSEVGFSCIMSMFASASQTAVSWRCAAPHTSSSKGDGGKEISVASQERAVMDLKRSLRAYYHFA